jgi:hypothetical protein
MTILYFSEEGNAVLCWFFRGNLLDDYIDCGINK